MWSTGSNSIRSEVQAETLPTFRCACAIRPLNRDAVLAGGLISYVPDMLAIARRHAQYVDRILRGASPAELPVEQPTEYYLIVNLKTAKVLGLAVAPLLLARADEVIE